MDVDALEISHKTELARKPLSYRMRLNYTPLTRISREDSPQSFAFFIMRHQAVQLCCSNFKQ